MVSIFCEPNGSPFVDANGNIQMLTGMEEFRQRLYNVFRTQLGSEPFYQEYGFDRYSLSKVGPNQRELRVKNMVLDALNINNIQDIYGIKSVDVYFSGQTGYANIVVTDISGIDYSETMIV